MTPSPSSYKRPPCRRLRAYAFDPILSRSIETYDVNEVTIELPWDDGLKEGPVDDYLEVVDYDPTSKAFYAPVNLNDKNLLGQDGLPPSEGNPQFHQQMVYAVARTTIGHFEWALGRRALWSPHNIVEELEKLEEERKANKITWQAYKKKREELEKDEFVGRLRIYPHALREANAYYTPVKKALLFGYFPASTLEPGENMPGETVFTCLSHDIVAHETTHALLDGLHRRFIEPTNMDILALHEAFADVVALFQHFTYPDVLRHQIARTRGNLERQNLLGELAYQFGQAIGYYGALRSAIGRVDPETKEWIPEDPNPEAILRATEPHERGAIFVAAVFEAFLTIYKWRIADLLRIATGGTGILPPGELHPDLVGRLSKEAAKTASHILNVSIRALDYCPPVDVDFGDYLRALITADADLVTDDRRNYRLAFIEAFRRRGIYPREIRNLSEESLLWPAPSEDEVKAFTKVFPKNNRSRLRKLVPDWELTTNRTKIYEQGKESRRLLHMWFTDSRAVDAKVPEAAHLVLDKKRHEAFYRDENGVPRLEVHSVRPARRIGPDGQTVEDLVIEMTQRRRGYYEISKQDEADSGKFMSGNYPPPDFIFRGGCTLLVDSKSGEVRYCIYKDILDNDRLDRMRRYLLGDTGPSLHATYFGDLRKVYFRRLTAGLQERELEVEPFALLNRSFELKGAIR